VINGVDVTTYVNERDPWYNALASSATRRTFRLIAGLIGRR